AIVGVADATWGEEVAAVVRVAPERAGAFDVEVLHAFCRERLAGYKCPRLWFVVETFPATPSGKVQKHRLTEMIGRGELARGAPSAGARGGAAAAARGGAARPAAVPRGAVSQRAAPPADVPQGDAPRIDAPLRAAASPADAARVA